MTKPGRRLFWRFERRNVNTPAGSIVQSERCAGRFQFPGVPRPRPALYFQRGATMQFHRHRLLRVAYERLLPGDKAAQFYRWAHAEARRGRNERAAVELRVEEFWEQDRCPYYLVFPGILPALLRVDLDVDGGLVFVPMRALSVRLPERGNVLTWTDEPTGEEMAVREILTSEIRVPDRETMTSERGLSVWVDIGEGDVIESPEGQRQPVPIRSYRNVRLKPGLSIREELATMPSDPSAFQGVVMPEEIWEQVFRLLVTLCLLENDPAIIEPDVLNRDRDKWERTQDPRLIERAKRRGKNGFRIGHKLEVIPHYRKPHLFRVWTGKGRTIPKVVMRKGSIVHREKVARLPSGFGGSDAV